MRKCLPQIKLCLIEDELKKNFVFKGYVLTLSSKNQEDIQNSQEMYRNMLEAANQIYSEYLSCSENVMLLKGSPRLKQLDDVIKQIQKEDFGIGKSEATNAILFADKSTISYANIHSEGDERFSFGLFFIPKGGYLPLHDHPNMFVFSKILMGKVKRLSFSLVDRRIQFNYQTEIMLQKRMLSDYLQSQQTNSQCSLLFSQEVPVQKKSTQEQLQVYNTKSSQREDQVKKHLRKKSDKLSPVKSSKSSSKQYIRKFRSRLSEKKASSEDCQKSLEIEYPQQSTSASTETIEDSNLIMEQQEIPELPIIKPSNQKINQNDSSILSDLGKASDNNQQEEESKKPDLFLKNPLLDMQSLMSAEFIEAVLESEEILGEGFIDDLDPVHKNLHYIEAIEDCVFFDVLLPHYDLKKRYCNYYNTLGGPHPESKKVLLQISNVPLNQCRVQYFTIDKSTCKYFQ